MSRLLDARVLRSQCTACSGTGHDPTFESDCGNCQPPTPEPAGTRTHDDTPPTAPAGRASDVTPTHGSENTMSNFWDDDEVQKAATSGAYHKFAEIGDACEGEIAALDKRVFDEGTAKERTAIEITFADESKVTAGQVKLMQALVEMRPQVGDTIRIELGDIEKRGSKTLKHFIVTHANSEGEKFTVDQTAA